MLVIVDYNAGNQTSVARALHHLGIAARVSANPDDLRASHGIIFPGVGAAPQAMVELRTRGIDQALREAVGAGKPLLGICLGCQILLEKSEEGDTQTLGIVPGECLAFPQGMREANGEAVKIPHMGWNSLKIVRPNRIFAGIGTDSEFYFVHGYHVAPAPDLLLATTHHGQEFCSAYGRDGLWCVQFHPEKSGAPGLMVLANFNAYCQERSHAL